MVIIIIQTFYWGVKRIPYLFPKKAAAFLRKFKYPSLETKSYKAGKKSIGKITPTFMLQV